MVKLLNGSRPVEQDAISQCNPSEINLTVDLGRRAALVGLFGGVAVLALQPGQARADTVTYTYDAQGRLHTATYSSGYVITYTYDSAGNRTQKVVATTGGPPAPLSASASTPYWNYSVSNGSDDAITAEVSGGVSPYSYAWTYVSGSTHVVATSPSSVSTSFGYNTFPTPHGGTMTATWKCTVTDSAAATASFSIVASMDFSPDD